MKFIKQLPALPAIGGILPTMGYNHCAPSTPPGKSASLDRATVPGALIFPWFTACDGPEPGPVGARR